MQHWAQQLVQAGNADDIAAMASVVALSERASHPVSRAAAALGKVAGSRLPHTEISDFKLVPGTHPRR